MFSRGSQHRALLVSALGVAVGLLSAAFVFGEERTGIGGLSMSFTLSSPAFRDQAEIPIQHTCEGEDVSPPLAWSSPPEGTRSLALIVDDPDAPDPKAPRMTWVHWVLYNIPAMSVSR